jgi:hypothetical protein
LRIICNRGPVRCGEVIEPKRAEPDRIGKNMHVRTNSRRFIIRLITLGPGHGIAESLSGFDLPLPMPCKQSQPPCKYLKTAAESSLAYDSGFTRLNVENRFQAWSSPVSGR